MLLASKNIVNKITRSVLAIFVGCFFVFVLLELSLRAFGFYLSHRYLFERVEEKQSSDLRILTLGESMTNSGVNPYPSQLEEILNANSSIKQKVKVINGGVPGTASRDIILNIEKYLEKYNPDIVVVMTGINNDEIVDYGQWAKVKNEDLFGDFKTYKLIKFLYQNIVNKLNNTLGLFGNFYIYASDNNVDDILHYIRTQNLDVLDKLQNVISLRDEGSGLLQYEKQLYEKLDNSTDKSSVYMELRNYYSGIGETGKAIACVLEALLINPRNSDAYQKLSDIRSLKPEHRERLVLKAIETGPHNIYAYSALARFYEEAGEPEKSLKVYKEGVIINPHSGDLFFELGKYYFRNGNLVEAEMALSEALKYIGDNNKRPDIYQLLANIYKSQDKLEEEGRVLGKAIESSNVLANNYPVIADILKKRGIKLIAMQYPLRDVNILKNILKNYDVEYVDNKDSFEKAIKNGGKAKYFVDLFAGDFGHCTPEGNRIMAENVASVILENILLRNGK